MSNLILKIVSKSHRANPIVPSTNNLRSIAVKIKIVYRFNEIKKVGKNLFAKKKRERKRKETSKLKNPYAKVLVLTSCIASKT